jgi:uncharacterized protein YdaU (DUF1376 family)
MTGRLPWFPMHAADFLMDTAVAEMTLEQRGAYITLLCHAWWNGSIPAANERLTTVVRSFSWSETHEVDHWWTSPLTECWVPHPDDPTKLINHRLEQERARQIALQEQRVAAGKLSAVKRLGAATSSGDSSPNDRSTTSFNDRSTGKKKFVQLTEQNRTEQNSQKTLPDGLAAAGEKHPAWTQRAIAVYQEFVPHPCSPGRILRVLKPFVERDGAEVVLAKWREYCRNGRHYGLDGTRWTEPPLPVSKQSPERFRDTYAEWGKPVVEAA